VRRLQGFSATERPRIRVRCGSRIESRAGRTDFGRARLEWRDGEWGAEAGGPQISGHLTPPAWAHALLLVPEHAAELAAGERAGAILLRWPDGFQTRG